MKYYASASLLIALMAASHVSAVMAACPSEPTIMEIKAPGISRLAAAGP
ncbi:MAG: hypothetical protein H0V62_13075 [Gammaproteobacteria bacterium]|nr:hypothetical protein [Gammaproteobacteria bacterium]